MYAKEIKQKVGKWRVNFGVSQLALQHLIQFKIQDEYNEIMDCTLLLECEIFYTLGQVYWIWNGPGLSQLGLWPVQIEANIANNNENKANNTSGDVLCHKSPRSLVHIVRP